MIYDLFLSFSFGVDVRSNSMMLFPGTSCPECSIPCVYVQMGKLTPVLQYSVAACALGAACAVGAGAVAWHLLSKSETNDKPGHRGADCMPRGHRPVAPRLEGRPVGTSSPPASASENTTSSSEGSQWLPVPCGDQNVASVTMNEMHCVTWNTVKTDTAVPVYQTLA
jgi:hypothetical protein